MTQMTMGKLKKAIEDYPDNAVIYMEPWNAYNKGKENTRFSQKALYTYIFDDNMTDKKALMIVGSIK